MGSSPLRQGIPLLYGDVISQTDRLVKTITDCNPPVWDLGPTPVARLRLHRPVHAAKAQSSRLQSPNFVLR